MTEKIKKYKFFIISIILLLCIITVESPFSYLHYENPPYYFYFIVIIINTLIYLFSSEKLIVAEKVIYSIITSTIAIICAAIFTDIILSVIYGYDQYHGELQSTSILESFLYYFFGSFISIGIFGIWLKYKKPIYR